MFTVNYENAATYKTMFIAACHCSADQWQQLLTLSDDKNAYYCHRTTTHNDTGIIVRLEPLCDDIGGTLAAEGIDDELIERYGDSGIFTDKTLRRDSFCIIECKGESKS